MHTEEIERLLRKARPRELPPGWKHQILVAVPKPERRPVFIQLSWKALAACWALILLLHLSTPDVPQGTVPFNAAAFLASNAQVKRLLTTGEWDPPPMEPLHIESIFRLPKAMPQASRPTT